MLSFKLTLKTLEVELDAAPFKLVELTGAQRDTYLNGATKRIRLGADGKAAGISSFDGIQTSLLALTLQDKDGKPVPEATMKNWPASVVESLFKESQTLSGLNLTDEQAAAAAKNAYGVSVGFGTTSR